jgi:hypothetical protein
MTAMARARTFGLDVSTPVAESKTRLTQLFPTGKTVPPELARGARLIPEAEAVAPAFLLGAPRAAPGELEAVLALGRHGNEGPDEVGAAGASVETELLDLEVRVLMEELRQDPLHLHPGRVTLELNPAACAALEKGEDVRLELGMSAGGFEVGTQ